MQRLLLMQNLTERKKEINSMIENRIEVRLLYKGPKGDCFIKGQGKTYKEACLRTIDGLCQLEHEYVCTSIESNNDSSFIDDHLIVYKEDYINQLKEIFGPEVINAYLINLQARHEND